VGSFAAICDWGSPTVGYWHAKMGYALYQGLEKYLQELACLIDGLTDKPR
jgi:hypothetical protein